MYRQSSIINRLGASIMQGMTITYDRVYCQFNPNSMDASV